MNELAIFGGIPIRKEPFPVWPRVTREMRDSLIDTFENQSWGVGSETYRYLQHRVCKNAGR
jgi:hypothetical protein